MFLIFCSVSYILSDIFFYIVFAMLLSTRFPLAAISYHRGGRCTWEVIRRMFWSVFKGVLRYCLDVWGDMFRTFLRAVVELGVVF